jgi:hypothetical protein
MEFAPQVKAKSTIPAAQFGLILGKLPKIFS